MPVVCSLLNTVDPLPVKVPVSSVPMVCCSSCSTFMESWVVSSLRLAGSACSVYVSEISLLWVLCEFILPLSLAVAFRGNSWFTPNWLLAVIWPVRTAFMVSGASLVSSVAPSASML